MKRVLILRLSAIGDVLIVLHFAKFLKEHGFHVALLTSSSMKGLALKDFDDIIYIDKKKLSSFSALKSYWREINQSGYWDFFINMHPSFRTRLLSHGICAKKSVTLNEFYWRRKFFRYKWTRPLVLKFFKKPDPVWIRPFLQFTKTFNFDSFEVKSHIEKLRKNSSLLSSSLSQSFVEQKKRKFIIIAPGASFENKRWPVEYYFQFALRWLRNHDDHDVKLIAGPHDEGIEIFDQFPKEMKARLINLKGKTELKDLWHEFLGAIFVLGNDSMSTHFADLLRVPSCVLFGPTSSYFGFTSLLEKSIIIENEDLNCRPCSMTGKRKCSQKNERICLKSLEPDQVYETVKVWYESVL